MHLGEIVELKLRFLEDFEYSSKARSVPVALEITTDEPRELAKKIDVKSIFLTNKDNEDNYFGYSQNILGVLGESFILTPGEPYIVNLDVLEKEDNLSDFGPGPYEVEAKVIVYDKSNSNGFVRKYLEAKSEIIIS